MFIWPHYGITVEVKPQPFDDLEKIRLQVGVVKPSFLTFYTLYMGSLLESEPEPKMSMNKKPTAKPLVWFSKQNLLQWVFAK